MRVASLLLGICLCTIVACDEGGSSTSKSAPEKTAEPEQKKPREVPSAATGARVFQRDAQLLTLEIARLETDGRPEDGDKQRLFDREVTMKLRQIDYALVALDINIKAEARLILQKDYAHNQSRQGRLLKEVDVLWREISEIRSVLRGKAKGTGAIPPGFTEDELKDRVADLEKKLLELKQTEKLIIAELEKQIELLEGKEIPMRRDTVLIKERDVYRALRKRAEKLLQKS